MLYVALAIALILTVWCFYVIKKQKKELVEKENSVKPNYNLYNFEPKSDSTTYHTQYKPSPVTSTPEVDLPLPFIPMYDSVPPHYDPLTPCEAPDNSPCPSVDTPSIDSSPASDGGGATGDF